MSFETYEAARRYAYLIRNVTQDKAMPPPFSIPLAGRVTNDPSLTPAQISALATWANLNSPRGDSHDAPVLPHDSAPWSIPKPDLIVKMPQPVAIPAMGKLDYVYEIVPTGLTEGRWIQMAEVFPFLRANLLQIMVVIRRPGSHWLRHAPRLSRARLQRVAKTVAGPTTTSSSCMRPEVPLSNSRPQWVNSSPLDPTWSFALSTSPTALRIPIKAVWDLSFPNNHHPSASLLLPWKIADSLSPPTLQSIGLKREGFCGETSFF
jgi:hypothetical protein